MPVSTANHYVSQETVETLEELLKAAKSGQVLGLALVAFLPRRRFWPHFSGYAQRDPTWARGCIKALDDRLSEAANARIDCSTTIV